MRQSRSTGRNIAPSLIADAVKRFTVERAIARHTVHEVTMVDYRRLMIRQKFHAN
jgi:hypothetical protein